MFARVFLTLILLCQTARADLVDKVMESSSADRAHAQAVVDAAKAVATPDISVELLLGMADVESDFDPTSVSRLIDGKRQTGPWRSDRAPKNATGNFYCGITQVKASTWKRCLAMRDVNLAMQAAVEELTYWLGRGKTIRKALQGHGCGNKGMKNACVGYAGRVLQRMRWFSGPRTQI